MKAKLPPAIPPIATRERCLRDLAAVTTIPEATRLWNIHKSTLTRWCNEGRVMAIKPQHSDCWLVSVRHMNTLLGFPNVDCERTDMLDPSMLTR